MMKRLALALALLVSAGIAHAAQVNTWECAPTQIWPRASTGATSDTLSRFAPTPDSLTTTDSVYVFNARLVVLVAYSSGSDSLLVPIVQARMFNGAWVGTGGASFLPFSGLSLGATSASGTPITGAGKNIWSSYNETTIAGSTPIPMVNDYLRWRVSSSDLRRYATASSATLAATGNIRIVAYVWR